MCNCKSELQEAIYGNFREYLETWSDKIRIETLRRLVDLLSKVESLHDCLSAMRDLDSIKRALVDLELDVAIEAINETMM